MLVPTLLVLMVVILLLHAYPLHRLGRLDRSARAEAPAGHVPLPRAHPVDARHWNSAYWD
ncbi:hypothetical protein [Jiangella rhizosphaerae]|uniref:Uncharacterized protein n=1 Tax=Jiangella rhizosphaerae TaxID=2293569 RepID=A0A418KRV2_9ACTN|nr:hypothetical protein [Jiangella rhizosphaerae]RIQ24956.1 hypothetical protein DY240_11740 [Jiangella rhizosphaerae]